MENINDNKYVKELKNEYSVANDKFVKEIRKLKVSITILTILAVIFSILPGEHFILSILTVLLLLYAIVSYKCITTFRKLEKASIDLAMSYAKKTLSKYESTTEQA